MGLGAGSYLNHNCENYLPYLGQTTTNGADPVYLYLDLIKQAEDFVAQQVVAGKSTIQCIKGKVVKKVTAIKPVCPKGYKKK